MQETIAIIDLGSNSCRMSVFSLLEDGSFRELRNVRELCRLSEGMSESGLLQETAMARTIESLKKFSLLANALSCTKMKAFATAAVRFAENGDEFLARVKKETGVEITLIDGETEAYYDYMAVIHTLPVTDCIITDTGGGSTEFILVKNKRLMDAISLPLGAVLLLEEFGENEDEMLDEMKNRLCAIPFLEEAKGLPLCAMGGSARALTALSAKDSKESIHGRHLTFEEVKKEMTLIKETPIAERAKIPYMEARRADIMMSGCAPVYTLMEMLGSPHLICCQTGLRDGVLFSMKEGK